MPGRAIAPRQALRHPPKSEAARIIAELMDRGITPSSIARGIGVSDETIRRIRTGAKEGVSYLPSLLLMRGRPDEVTARESRPDPATAATPAVEAAEPPTDDRGPVERLAAGIKAAILGDPDGAEPQVSVPSAKSRPPAGPVGEAAQRANLADLMQTLLALGITLPTDLLIRDPYKPCTPTGEEASAIAAPIARIIARELALTGKISDRTLDIVACLAAVGFYAPRATQTAGLIRSQVYEQQQRPGGVGGSAGGAHPGAPGAGLPGGRPGPVQPAAAARPDGSGAGAGGGAGAAADSAAARGHAHPGAAVIAQLLTADAEGRRLRGLN